jgi:hypothetical protein
MKKLIAGILIIAAGAAFAQQTARIVVPVDGVKRAVETREVVVTKEVAVAAVEPISLTVFWPQTVIGTNGAAQVVRREIGAVAVQRLVDADGRTIATTRRTLTEAQIRALGDAVQFDIDAFIGFVSAATKVVTEAKE